MGFRATLNFRKFKVALNPMYRISPFLPRLSPPSFFLSLSLFSHFILADQISYRSYVCSVYRRRSLAVSYSLFSPSPTTESLEQAIEPSNRRTKIYRWLQEYEGYLWATAGKAAYLCQAISWSIWSPWQFSCDVIIFQELKITKSNGKFSFIKSKTL